MNITLNERSAAYCRETFHQIKTVQELTECIVPDVLEDIGQIVSAQAQICLKSKELTDHGVRIGAEAEIGILYITEGRDRISCLKSTKSFEIPFDTPPLERDADAQAAICCMGVQARAVNPRKISAQLSVRAELSCWSDASLCIPSEASAEEECGLQLRQSSADCVLVTQLAEKNFVVNEQLPLDARTEPGSLCFSRVRLLCYDHQPLGSKILLKGGAELTIGYETPDGSMPRLLEQCLPFSVLIDMPDEDSLLGRVTLEPTALYTDLGDAINGSRVIEIELHATAQVRFERRETIGYLSDAYSTVCPVCLEVNKTSISRGHSEALLNAAASDRIPVETERGEVVSVFSDLLSYTAVDGKAELSASVSILLRAEDGSYGAVGKLLTFEAPLPAPGGEIVGARITAVNAARTGEEILIDVSAALDYTQNDCDELRYLSSLELDTENAYDPSSLPSLTIAKRGTRDLWELARLYHSSVDAIEKMEKDFPMAEDLLLIPRA